ncbi:PIH1 domain-containing protein 1-like [Toxorhynchites rutilus septentrionalis]|uniref:PIH1 domain-containing protein 1-like n=1 Tax=Toxorhynchites rutilus septentrionalis TaxID=329112 RepID=UPI0024792BF3|nr:PIH1 domain-containing protein 1-like [Toxorhynchites rutilus septentrionalis]
MSKPSTAFLDADSSLIEKNLRFVRDETEEEFNNMFGPIMEQAQDISSGRSKIVKPSPGFCVKAFRQDNREKFFLNICQTDGIPPPEDITEDQLLAILNDGSPGSFKIPMSITQPRSTQDSSDKTCQVCDIAVSCKFFSKIEKGGLMRDFLITIIFEGINTKYNIALSATDWRVLKNKKVIGKLITHNIQNRDVKTVYENYKNPTQADLQTIQQLDNPKGTESLKPKKKLIEVMDADVAKTIKNVKNEMSGNDEYIPDPTKVAISRAGSKKPDCRLFREPAVGNPKVLIGEFYLPQCISANEITLDVGEDRILLEARKKGYLLDEFVAYKIDTNLVQARFNTETNVLDVIMPILAG